MPSAPDSLSQRLLDTIQSNFPLQPDPYGVLAQQLDATRDEVKDAVYALCVGGGVRRIGASFDSRKLGYTSTLCALAVPGGEDDVLRAAEVVNMFPGVTHNYGRAHRYNMWFTLITRSIEEKTEILDAIRAQTGCGTLLDMPSIRKYKVSVDFGRHRAQDRRRAQDGQGANSEAEGAAPGTSGAPGSPTAAGASGASGSPTASDASLGRMDASGGQAADAIPPFDAEDAFDVAIVRWAQDDIARDVHGELIDDPYLAGAAHLNKVLGRSDISADSLLARLRQLKDARAIRRFGAMVRHQVIGFAFNSMTVWNIPDDMVDQAGKLFASAHFVSHCYTRPRMGDWKTNLYAMTHAQTAEELVSNIETLQTMLEASEIPYAEYFALETTAEYKKVSMRYFMPAWPAGLATGGSPASRPFDSVFLPAEGAPAAIGAADEASASASGAPDAAASQDVASAAASQDAVDTSASPASQYEAASPSAPSGLAS